jgi:uncharacterized protein (DUF2252 family)
MAGTLKYAAEHQRALPFANARNLKMASSAHAYMLGNAPKFYEWLGTADSSTIPVGPPVWICDKPEADITRFAAQHPLA